MGARQQADLLVVNADWAITVDATRRVIRDAGIAVKDGRFVAAGKSAEIERTWAGGTVVSAKGMVATPGLVDAHLHSSFSLARGLADESNAQSFLFEHMYPYEAVLDEEDVHIAVALAAAEMLRHGVTCFVEPGNYHPDATVRHGVTCFVEPGNYHPDATVRAAMAAGLRMVLAVSCFDNNKAVTGIMPEAMIEDTARCIAKTEALFDRYPGSHGERLTVSASFRGMNNSSDALILALKGIADRYDAVLQTHACYSYFTHDASVVQFGKPEIERLESLGVLDQRMLLLHGGWLEPHEIALLAKRKPRSSAARRLRSTTATAT